ncbi:hypothetical protein FRC06_001466 [Ceratobasidium sp. 370]|nr:hypothetical protein FRC06_001466 [Ceratobasidium sp. 370]
MIDLPESESGDKDGDEDEDVDEDEDEDENGESSHDEAKPIGEDGTGSKKTVKGRKRKPKTSDYTGVPRKLLNVTFKFSCVHLATTGMFPDPKYYDAIIRKSWKSAAAEIRVNVKNYPIDDDHVTVLKGRINSFRGRVRDRVKPPVAGVYGLTTIFGEELKDHVNWLVEKQFYRKPGASSRTGHYEHPFIVEALYQAFFVGRNPPGIRFPKAFNPIPLPAIAFVCALIHFLIEQYKTGEYKESRAECDSISRLHDTHLKNVNKFQECVPTRCAKLQGNLYKLVMRRTGKVIAGADEVVQGPTILNDDDFGSDDESSNQATKATPKKTSKPPTSSCMHPPHHQVTHTSSSVDANEVLAELEREVLVSTSGRAAGPKLRGSDPGWGDQPLGESVEGLANGNPNANSSDSEHSDTERSGSSEGSSSEGSDSESLSSESSDDGTKGEKGSPKGGERAGLLEELSDDEDGKNGLGGGHGDGGRSGGEGSSKGNGAVTVSAALDGDTNGDSGGSGTGVGASTDVGVGHSHGSVNGGSGGQDMERRSQPASTQPHVEAPKKAGAEVEPTTSTARPSKRSLDTMEAVEESEDQVDGEGKGEETEKQGTGKGKGKKTDKTKPAKRKKRW